MPPTDTTPLRVLVLCPFPPDPLSSHGGGRVAGQFVTELARRLRVGLIYLRSIDEAPIPDTIRDAVDLVEEVRIDHVRHSIRASVADRLGLAVGRPLWATFVRSGSARAAVDRVILSWRPHIVQAEFAVMGQYLERARGVPRVLVDYDPAPAAYAEYATASGVRARPLDRIDAWAWRRFQRATMKKADAVVSFTERDRATLLRWSPAPDSCVVIPPGFWIPPAPRDHGGSAPPSLLFVGGFSHRPNADAAERLVATIFPAVRSMLPGCRLQVVGASPPSHLRSSPADGVEVLGFVPDLSSLIDRAAVIAIPLRIGGGIRVKVMESLADGKAVVASARAVEGLAVTDGREFVRAESDTEFAHALTALLQDEQARIALGRQARAWAERHLGWDAAIREYEALYGRLMSGTDRESA